ncbi:DNA oxidative demethylase AlkB [Robbsia sp. Bb-Pol-6]|uniref:DNA oxidative demethylase AlkB n=1 Tax=Robbsia betulipollinis TaxID=2981849 RepID=A0ABT3ZPP8_9BURK|nr:DNA oxidative demethylase AlkB [Robbsia betulipollinis]MCY0388519.1 DNA oxidative demethylase AlkB [Robbsia betulipollinis]
MTTADLFESMASPLPPVEAIGPASYLLRGFALSHADGLIGALHDIAAAAPFRRMRTPGGATMSVALTNCGMLGWVSDRHGYRYERIDPRTGRAWPPLPDAFSQLAREAAVQAGFDAFAPDACLINRYLPGTKMSLHQDRDERDFSAPIVSVSLGIPAVFQFGGMARGDKALRVPVFHGDVVVWGGVDRLRFHGVLPLKTARHATLGEQRINLTFRKAG